MTRCDSVSLSSCLYSHFQCVSERGPYIVILALKKSGLTTKCLFCLQAAAVGRKPSLALVRYRIGTRGRDLVQAEPPVCAPFGTSRTGHDLLQITTNHTVFA